MMDCVNDNITDEEFVPFLRGLGVETYKKSFEWILNDPEFSRVMKWMYTNLDHNNALSAREEYRYIELEKRGHLLSNEDLEETVTSIQSECKGIPLPGELESLEDLKREINNYKERLTFLEKQDKALKELIKKNELSTTEVSRELTSLNAVYQQCTEDESTSSEECLSLAEDLETITEGILDVIGETFNLYGNSHIDKDTAKRFLIFGPFESYRQSQVLFHSHFDLYTSKKFDTRQNDSISEDDIQTILMQAKVLEERLLDAVCEYVDSNAELMGEQAKLALVTNYTNVHPSQIQVCMIENHSAVELLRQEEAILEQEVQNAVKHIVDSQTRCAVETTANSALVIREQIHDDLTYLLEVSKEALALDRILYFALRHSLRTVEEFAQFAAQMRQYCMMESQAVQSRIQSMNDICAEQEACEQRLQSFDTILHVLYKILGVQYDNDALKLVKHHHDLQARIEELSGEIEEQYRKKEEEINNIKLSSKPLLEYIYDGCTKQANSRDRLVASLSHSLVQELERVDKKAVEASVFFTYVKNGDKSGLRKLWQWFLTDPAQLLAAIKGVMSS